MKIADARTLSPAAQEDLRRKAILAWREGKSKSEVARLFGVSREAVHQ
jgi:transposase